MGILEKVVLELRNIQINGKPNMKNYGEITDYCEDFSYCFTSGKSYSIIGGCGSGAWAISCLLTGRESKIKGDIILNGNMVSPEEISKLAFYVGEGNRENKISIGKNSISKQLQAGVKKGIVDKTYTEIIDMFGLSKDRLDYEVEDLSWERWRASIAIGFANGRKIFCFPWCSTMMVNDLIMNSTIHKCIDILKKYGNIVILPTEIEKSVDFLLDEIIHINNSRSIPSERAKQIVLEWQKIFIR